MKTPLADELLDEVPRSRRKAVAREFVRAAGMLLEWSADEPQWSMGCCELPPFNGGVAAELVKGFFWWVFAEDAASWNARRNPPRGSDPYWWPWLEDGSWDYESRLMALLLCAVMLDRGSV